MPWRGRAPRPDPAGAAARSPQSSISPETRLKLYRTMQECRMLEKRAYDLFMQNLIKGTSHLALGQEAIAAGFGSGLTTMVAVQGPKAEAVLAKLCADVALMRFMDAGPRILTAARSAVRT